MKKLLMSCLLSLCALFVLGSPAFAGCVDNFDLSVNPATVSPGESFTASASIHNCSNASERVVVEFTLTGPHGISHAGSVVVFLLPGQTRAGSITLMVPPPAPTGSYTVTADAEVNGMVLATTSATLTVT